MDKVNKKHWKYEDYGYYVCVIYENPSTLMNYNYYCHRIYIGFRISGRPLGNLKLLFLFYEVTVTWFKWYAFISIMDGCGFLSKIMN